MGDIKGIGDFNWNKSNLTHITRLYQHNHMVTVKSYFSGKDNLQKVILKHLDTAEKSIHVAVAWFTDVKLFAKLLEKADAGISVNLIITKHDFNTQSRNNYTELKSFGGFFAELGDDNNLMHHKFCVIDNSTVLTGSFNWTKRANTSNSETLMVIQNDLPQAAAFYTEFEALKKLAGYIEVVKNVDIAKTLKTFELFRAFLNMGEPNKIAPYLVDIRDNKEVDGITQLIISGKFDEALPEIDAYVKKYSQLINISVYEREYLKTQIKLLNESIKQLEIEVNEVEATIAQYEHRYFLEINPILMQILQLKKKIFEKLKRYGVIDTTYEDLEREYNERKREFEVEKEKVVPNLNSEEELDLKKMYREGAGLCHPDSSTCIYEDKKVAESVFSKFTDAYKAKDIETVRAMLEDLRMGKPISENYDAQKHEKLRARFEALKQKYDALSLHLSNLKTSEPFKTIQGLKDWDAHFSKLKLQAETNLLEIKEKFVKK